MSLLSAFDRQCRMAPDNLAFSEVDRLFSYRQIRERAQALGRVIVDRGASCRRAAVALDRGIDAAVAILGVLGAGACYIPLDMKNPATRLQFIVDDADPQCVIGKGTSPDWLSKPELWLDIESCPEFADTEQRWPLAVDAEELAAILYTSGSTGTPKGVALSHRAMRNFSDWAASTFGIVTTDRIASLAPFYFDLSVFDLFSSLGCGASVHFVPAALTLAPSRLSAWLAEQRISVFYTVPSLLSFLALKGSLPATPLPHLRAILFAGEVFPTPVLKVLCKLLPSVDFYNLYGPTETNVCCYWPIRRERLDNGQPIPIGVPAGDAVLDIDAESGELRVRSSNNLSGYWQQGKLMNALSADRFFVTGDKVSVNEWGELCFHGRLDRMLKCSGYRVEPAEIEAAILQCPGVIACAVAGIADNAGGRRTAAALVLEAGTKLETVVQSVKQRLPHYMLPVKWLVLDALPFLSNGKTDYPTLRQQLEKY